MLEGDSVLARWQFTDRSFALAPLDYPTLVAQDGAGNDVSRLGCLRPAPAVGDVNDCEGATGVTRVGEFHPFPGAKEGQPRRRYRETSVCR